MVSCPALRALAVLGQCAAGVQAVQVNDADLVYSDNPRNSTAAFASPADPAYTGSLAALPLQAVLVKVTDQATLERVRTFLARHAPPATSAGQGIAATPAIAYGMSILTVIRLAPPGTAIPQLGRVYYATMGAGLAIALIVIGVTLPLLKRLTGPDNARFE